MDLRQELVGLIPDIRRFSYALTRSPADADDLLQATLERILSNTPPEGVELKKWMFKVCRNLWIDELRSKRVRRDAAGDLAEASEPGVSAETAAISRIQLDRARQGMNELPDEQREVLALVAIGGMAYRDASQTLGVPIGTIMSRLARARTALARYVEGEA